MAIRLEFKSNSKQAQKDIQRLERSVGGVDTEVSRAAKSFNGMAKAAKIAAGAFAGVFAVKQLAGVVDNFTLIENRIALVTGRTQEMVTTFAELQQISLKARGSLAGVADLYNRLGRTTKSLGVSNEEILQVTETIQKAITISGSSSQSAEAAIVQLGQGLAAGALRGQELNSVMEQTPRVAAAIAAELGVGIGELRKMAEQGKITSEVVVNAFKSQKDVIDEEFGAVDATVGQGFEQLGASIALVTRELIAGTGAVTPFANKLLSMSAALTAAAPAAREMGAAIAAFDTGEFLNDLVEDVNSLANNAFDFALDSVNSFVRGVDEAFFWVYDRVVGNSWWPDLIDGVVDYTDYLKGALYKVASFTRLVEEPFKNVYESVSSFFKSSGSAIELGVVLTITDYKYFIAYAASGLVDAGSQLLDYIEREFPLIFNSISTVAASIFVSKFGTALGGFALLLGSTLSAGVSATDLLDAASEFVELIVTGLGKAIGALVASLPEFAAGFLKIVVESAFSFGKAILDQLGIIGDAIQVITLGLADGIVGALVTGILGSRILDVIFGTSLSKSIVDAFKVALTASTSLFAGIGSLIIPSTLFTSASASIGALVNGYNLITDSVKKLIAGETTLASVRAVLASTTGALYNSFISIVAASPAYLASLWAQVTASAAAAANWISLNGAMMLGIALQWSAAAASTALSVALGVVATAARAAWLALSGPLAPVIIGIGFLVTLIGSLIPATAHAADNAERTASGFNSLKVGLLNLIGQGYNLNIEVDIDTGTAKEAIDSIGEYNENLLYRLNREADDSFWFDWADDVSTWIQLKFTGAFTAVSNVFTNLKNSAKLMSNELFGTDFETEALETRSAIQQQLDKISKDLYIDIDLTES